MITTSILRIGFIGTALTVAVGAAIWQQRQAEKLERIVTYQREENVRLRRAEADNRRAQAAVTSGESDEAMRVLRAEIDAARQHVALLERQVERAKVQRDAGDIAVNRDPVKGMVLLEHFRSAGRATPAAAFQTFIWAAANADFDEMAKGIWVSPTGRQKGLAFLAKLPDDTRKRFGTPEKFVAVPFADYLTRQEGFQIVGQSVDTEGHTVLQVRRLKNEIVQPSEKNMPFRLESSGWQLVLGDDMVESASEYLAEVSLEIKPPPP